ncbi:uncharacterized protein [Lolium perenne]|uniref:uncharacterized protein isoform X1 n=1 Tax=Lolium perenne TaxID=4522 RepID=UPI003A997E62
MPRPCASPSSGSHAKQQYAAATRTEFIRLGTQFIGYRDHAKKVEETLAEANKRADALDLKVSAFLLLPFPEIADYSFIASTETESAYIRPSVLSWGGKSSSLAAQLTTM